MERMDIINEAIRAKGYRRYLEIGIYHGRCFDSVRCEEKVGVDPAPLCDIGSVMRLTSDEFFGMYNGPQFDIVFVDGLHHADQVYRDVTNSLRILAPGGAIVCHDSLPTTEIMQRVPIEVETEWTGDVWKALLRLRAERLDIRMFTLDTDYGVTVIERGAPEPWRIGVPDPGWDYFLAEGRNFLNVKGTDYLKEWLRV